jgi:hypothetical protein
MKKVKVAVLAMVLGISTIVSANGAELTRSDSEVWYAEISTNGKVSAASWDSFNEDTDSQENFVAFNFDARNTGWSEPISFDVDYINDVTVLDSGTIFITYVIDSIFYFQTTTNGTDFSDQRMLLPNGDLEISRLEVESIGDTVTLIGIVEEESKISAYSWTSGTNLGTWNRKLIANNLFPSGTYGYCPISDGECSYRIRGLEFGQNAKGQQALMVRTRVEDNRSELTSKWVTWVYERKTNRSDWLAPKKIDTTGPLVVDSFANSSGPVIVTTKGKVAFSYTYGFNDDPRSVRIYVNSGFNTAFAQKDRGALSTPRNTDSPDMINIGEKLFSMFTQYDLGGYENPKVFYGEVGKLSKAKRVGATSSHRGIELSVVNGKATLISEAEVSSIFVAQVRKLNGAKWSAPRTILENPNGFGIYPRETSCTESKKLVVCTTPILSETFNTDNYPIPTGLLVELVK